MSDKDRLFPGAPDGSYVNEDGWLAVGDECWTEREWATTLEKPRGTRHYSGTEARRRSKREYMQRQREKVA